MIRIDLPSEIPEVLTQWKQRADELTAEILATQTLEQSHTLIDRHRNHWRDPVLLAWLSEISFEKCWYTETFFGGDYQEVEHFRPKKGTKNIDGSPHPSHQGYYWLAFDLENYRLCKSRPNRKKSTFFPVADERFRSFDQTQAWQDETPLFLDPKNSDDVLLLSFDDTGKPVPDEHASNIDIQRVKFTIEKFHLDERTLNLRRQEKWATCRALFNSYLNALKIANDTGSVSQRAVARAELDKLLAMGARNSEFSSVAKESLMKLGDQHAYKIASLM